ncbi:MAG: rhodanese-like domain-containing protein [Aestuariivita sp.]|nr:rhodanese-like domain-containing protein [Aestuariivita sp.]
MRLALLTKFFTLAFVTSVSSTELPKSKQTVLKLYLTAQETKHFLDDNPNAFFVDVRTTEEVDEVGLAEGINSLIPIFLKNTTGSELNPDFLPGMITATQKNNILQTDPIVIICRSGNRSATAVDLLAKLGFRKVYTVTDGYEGDKAKSGSSKGLRTVNGWKNANLPWNQKASSSCEPAIAGGRC